MRYDLAGDAPLSAAAPLDADDSSVRSLCVATGGIARCSVVNGGRPSAMSIDLLLLKW